MRRPAYAAASRQRRWYTGAKHINEPMEYQGSDARRAVYSPHRRRSFSQDHDSGAAGAHALYTAVFLCAACSAFAWIKKGICQRADISGDWIMRDSGLRHGRRSGVSLKPTFGFLIGFAVAAYVTGRVFEIRKDSSFSWLLFSAFLGLLADYGCGMVYFYVCSNFVLGVSVGWKLVLINCFLLTVSEDFILCVLAAVLAKRLIPILKNLVTVQ